MYEAAREESGLAKANLSHAYIDRGFLAKGEELAEEVVRNSSEEVDRERAVGALKQIAAKRSAEKKTEERIVTEAQAERAFRARYAEAFVTPVGTPINGVFDTPHGKILFMQEGNRLFGEATFKEQRGPGLGGLLVGLPGGFQPPPLATIRTLHFDAEIEGRSGCFKLQVDEKEETSSLLSFPKLSRVKGLVILAHDGQSFDVLEEEEQTVKIYRATRLGSS